MKGLMRDVLQLTGMRTLGGEPTWTMSPPWWDTYTLQRHKFLRDRWHTLADADSAVSLTLEQARHLNARFARDAHLTPESATRVDELNRLLADENVEGTQYIDLKLLADNGPFNCCASPSPGPPIQRLVEETHDTASIRLCTECGARWLYGWHEYVTFSDDGDLVWHWYALLSEEEAAQLAALAGQRPDYRFLRDRTVIIVHQGEATTHTGPPLWT